MTLILMHIVLVANNVSLLLVVLSNIVLLRSLPCYSAKLI